MAKQSSAADDSGAEALPEDAGRGADARTPPRSVVHRWLLPASVVAALWTVALLAVVAVRTDGLARVAAGLGGLVALVVPILGLFPPLSPPSVSRQTVSWAVRLVLCADVLASIIWPTWVWYRSNTAIDVTAQVKITGQNHLSPGEHATLSSGIPESRKNIAVTLRAHDSNGDQGDCVPQTSLSVMSVSAVDPTRAVTVAPGSPAKIPLVPGLRQITLTVTVGNSRGDPNCAVDLSLSKVVLSNQ